MEKVASYPFGLFEVEINSIANELVSMGVIAFAEFLDSKLQKATFLRQLEEAY